MSFYPSEYHLQQNATAKETKVTDPSLSVEAEAKQSLATEHQVSGEYVQSFVIVNDIDVEEELSKAKKLANTNTSNANNNFFKALSMSFYGKVKSHSLDHQEQRDSHKTSNTTQGGHKAIAPRKISAHTPPESKRNTVKDAQKTKAQDAAKKSTLPVKNLQLVPEQFRKRLTSPKDESIKVYSPVVAGKNYQVGNFVSKNLPKKETTFSQESQSRPQTAKKRLNGPEEEERGNATPDLKNTYTGRSSSPKGGEYKKQSSFNKLHRNKNRVLESIEEKTQTLDVEPSALDIRPQDHEIVEEVQKSTITPKGSRIPSKQSSREGSAKTMKDKPHYTPSTRPGTSGAAAQMKFNLRDQIDAKAHFFEQESSKTNIISGGGDKTPKTPSRDTSKKIDLTRDTSKKTTPNTTASKTKNGKTNSQEIKKETNSVEKFRYLGIVDLQDSDNDDESRQETGKNQANKTMDRKQLPTNSYKVDRQQKSPGIKLYERIPTALSTGIGNWGIEPTSLAKDSATNKQISKRGNGSPEVKGSTTNSSNNLAINKKPSTPGSHSGSGKEVQRVKKNNSEEKIAKVDLYDQWKGKKFEFGDNGRNVYTPKYEVNKPKDKFFDPSGKPIDNKTRPTSPIPIEGRKPLGLLDKLLAQKKSVREKL